MLGSAVRVLILLTVGKRKFYAVKRASRGPACPIISHYNRVANAKALREALVSTDFLHLL